MSILDRTDLRLLAELADAPRATVVDLAQRLGLSRNTVQARMAKLEASGVLLSYQRAYSPEVLGYPLQAYVALGVRQMELPRISAKLARIPEVLQANGMSGSTDLLVLVACRSARHLYELDARILAIEGVERTETSIVMQEVVPFRVSGLLAETVQTG